MSRHVMSDAPTATDAPPAEMRTAPSWSRHITVIALAISLVAVGLAAWSLVRSLPETTAGPPAATDQQTADARIRACAASNTVATAVSFQTHADPGSDPAAMQALAANSRLSMTAGSSYLLSRLDPATPPALATEIRSFADNLQAIAVHAMAGVNNDDKAQAARLRDSQVAVTKVSELCK